MHSEDDEPLLEGTAVPDEAWRLSLAPGDLRDAVWARTVSTVRAQRRKRKVLFAGLLAAVYAVGIATPWLLSRGRPAMNPPQQTAESPAGNAGHPADLAPATLDDMLKDREQFAVTLASSSREKQIELLKAAGDHSLGVGDTDMALSCYRRLLTLESPKAGEKTDFNDTWLLRSLKQARLQEESHEASQS